jgi:hypothetical protein
MPKNTTPEKTADGGLPSTDLCAFFHETENLYIIKDTAGGIRQVMMLNDRTKRWGLFVVGDAEPYDTDQYRHDLLERNQIRIANSQDH